MPETPANAGSVPADIRAALDKRITELVTPHDERSRDPDGVPPQLPLGIIGFTEAPKAGYIAVIGKGEDSAAVRSLVLRGLPQEASRYISTESAEYTTEELERVWRAVRAYNWASGTRPSYSLDVDAESGRILMIVSGPLSDENRVHLQDLGRGALKIEVGGPFDRL